MTWAAVVIFLAFLSLLYVWLSLRRRRLSARQRRECDRLWAEMVRRMDVEMMVPQHGCYFVGKPMIHKFLDWISDLDCGIDLLGQDNYRCP